MPNLTAILAVALLATCASAMAAMYRWVDEYGVTVYSQTPPPSGDAIQLRQQSGPSAEDAEAARERLQRQQEATLREGEARMEAEAEQAKKAQKERQRAESCEAVRGNLDKFRNLGRRMIRTPDGRVLRLSEDQVETQIRKTKAQVDEYCN